MSGIRRRGSGPIPSRFEINDRSVRSHVEAGLGACDDGSPRMMIRHHLLEIRRLLNTAEHRTSLADLDGPGTRYALVPDQEIGL